MVKDKRSPLYLWLRAFTLAIFVLGTIFPFYYALINSFRTIRNLPDLGWVPTALTLDNWLAAFGPDSPVPRWLLNSILVTIAITTISTLVDSLAGYAFARKRFPGKNLFFFAVVLFGLTIPTAMLIIPIYGMMVKAGLINTYLALILPAASSLGTFMMRQAISEIPLELDEAARIDGCTDTGIFWRIIMPLSMPAIAAVFIVLFLTHWNSFLYPLLVTNKEEMRTLTVGLYLLAPGDRTYGMPPPWDLITVMIALQFVPVLVIFLIFQEYFTRGIAMSGMK